MMRRDALREYVRGSLWVLPTACVFGALLLGVLLSQVQVGPNSPLAFQGTADDARSLLAGITGTLVTVIALLLGLAVVALQLSSTQFSPRLLRNFLRDRPNQVVLGVFVGTFAYSAGGLFTVGVAQGQRDTVFPRFAVSFAVVLLFVSLALLIFFADHLAHSLQVDNIMRVVERNTLPVIGAGVFTAEGDPPAVPAGATTLTARRSGYVQAVDVRQLAATLTRHRFALRLRPRVGEHVVAGTVLAWAWPTGPRGPRPHDGVPAAALDRCVRIGFERTLEQDPGFGFRQLLDTACKALSPAINDPYTAVQAVEHLSVLFGALAGRSVGDHVARDRSGAVVLVVPGRRFAEYLDIVVGLVRRYGVSEPTVIAALLRLLGVCAAQSLDDPGRWTAIEEQARLLVEGAESAVRQADDLTPVRAEAQALIGVLAARRVDRPVAAVPDAAPWGQGHQAEAGPRPLVPPG